MSPSFQLLLIVAALVLFWAIVMRPARKAQLATQKLQREIAVGDEVVISAGIFGTIREIDGSSARIEIAPGTVIKVARQVVVRRADELPTEEPEDQIEDQPKDEPSEPESASDSASVDREKE